MRTKHLLTALMLPAVFAACTQEEYDVVDSSAKVNERIELGQVALDFGGAESRFAAGTGNNFNGFVPEEGDVLGAALVDNAGATNDALVYNKAGVAAHKGLYNLTSYINTNYAYEKNGSNWESAANMVEGNYLFYLPYNAGHTVRTPLVATLPVTQTLEVAEDGVVKESLIDYALDQNSIMALGYSFIDRDDDKQVSVKMLPVYAYPLVKLVNSYEEDNTDDDKDNPVGVDLTIKKIVVKNSNNFTVSAPIYAGDNKTVLKTEKGAVKEFNREFKYRNSSNTGDVTVPNGSYAAYDVEGENYVAFTSSLLDTEATTKVTSPAIVVKPTENFTIAAGKATEFYLVIPAEDYAAKSLTIEVSTNKGTFEKTIKNPAIAAGKRYPLAEYEDGELIAPVEDPDGSLAIAAGKGSEYCVKLGENTIASESIMVTTTAELVAELQNAVEEKSLNVTTLTKDVCFNAAAARAFKANKESEFKLTINGEITISSGLTAGTVSTKSIDLNGKAYINGDVTINKQWYFGHGNNIASAVFAEFVDGNIVLDELKINGKAEVKAGAVVTVKNTVTAFDVDNKGTLNLYGEVSLLSNTGNVNVGSASATKDSEGTKLTVKTYNNSANGTITVNKWSKVANIVNAGTVENYGEITAVSNSNLVNNYGKVAGTNTKLIDLKSVDAIVGEISGIGYICNNIDINSPISASTMAVQKVYYEFANQTINGALYPQAGQFNTIILKNTTWAPTESQDLEVENGAMNIELKSSTISVYTPNVTIALPDVYCEGSNVVKGNSKSKVTYKSLKVKAGDANKITTNNIQWEQTDTK